ncbi:MAG: hypothetical protein NC231_12020 [Bacillus sp. (in: Bacteria)]|nr:hypothetical protein [Bacillus sp. (in: firmicutes)]MCM1428025.1 hypothetical protein [Eubacterium sp.]
MEIIMGNVYAIDTEQNLIIYSARNYICLRTAIGENLTRPIILRSDYASGLSDMIYNNTIYYAYQNTNQDIIIRSVIERDNLYKISSQNTPDCFYPQIAAIQKTLILFYFVKNPIDNSFCFKALLPFEPEQKLILPGTLFSSNKEASSAPDEAVFSSLPTLQIVSSGTMLLLHLSHDTEEFIFSIDESLQCEKLIPASSMPVQEPDNSKELLLQTQNQIAKLQSELSTRDQLIQSIRKQYEELMDTAMKYRDESVKWYNKFYGK